MPAGQQLGRVSACSRLLGHGTYENVVELEGWAEVNLARQLSRCLEVLFDNSAQLGEFGYGVRASFYCPLERRFLADLIDPAILTSERLA